MRSGEVRLTEKILREHRRKRRRALGDNPICRKTGGVHGHAGIFTTAPDLAKFARMILNKGNLEGVRLLQPENVELMTSIQSPESVPSLRGLGWDIDSSYSGQRGEGFPYWRLRSYGVRRTEYLD